MNSACSYAPMNGAQLFAIAIHTNLQPMQDFLVQRINYDLNMSVGRILGVDRTIHTQ